METNKTMLAILKVLQRHPDSILGSRELSRQLKLHGIELTERTIRYHLKIMDERGLTEVIGKEGRKITAKGKDELGKANVSERVGFIISKIETLSYLSDLDIETQKGNIILNVSYFPEERLKDAVAIMRPVFQSPYVMSSRVVFAKGGETIGEVPIPEGMIGLGTVCSVVINGVLLKAGIPVVSRFGGVLQIQSGAASRFTALISYEGSSLDPLLIFIKSRMSTVSDAVSGGTGNVLASFREIPVVSLDRAREVEARLKSIGIGGILFIGNPNQPLLEIPVGLDKAGLVVIGGLNPVAALEESGVPTESSAMSTLFKYEDTSAFEEAVERL